MNSNDGLWEMNREIRLGLDDWSITEALFTWNVKNNTKTVGYENAIFYQVITSDLRVLNNDNNDNNTDNYNNSNANNSGNNNNNINNDKNNVNKNNIILIVIMIIKILIITTVIIIIMKIITMIVSISINKNSNIYDNNDNNKWK